MDEVLRSFGAVGTCSSHCGRVVIVVGQHFSQQFWNTGFVTLTVPVDKRKGTGGQRAEIRRF